MADTLTAYREMTRVIDEARDKYSEIAKNDFPKGTRVRWRIFANPPIEGEILSVGYLGLAEVLTRAGSRARVDAYRLEKIEPEA